MEDQTFDRQIIEEKIKIIQSQEVQKVKEKMLGEGKFGKVYLGIYETKSVAIKKLKLENIEEFDIKEILKEIKTIEKASQLCYHVPKFFGIWKGKKGLSYNLIFEYVEGETLRDKLNKMKMTLVEKHNIIYQIAECLNFLHENKLLHRDIKPENIIIDNCNRIRLIDFGTAKLATSTITYTSSAIGTTHYMAPENFDFSSENEMADKPVPHSTAVDVWSLGVMITEILSGVFPYSHITKNEQIIESLLIQQKPFPIPNQIKKHFKDYLPIIEKCLVIDRLARCTSRDVMDFFKPYIS